MVIMIIILYLPYSTENIIKAKSSPQIIDLMLSDLPCKDHFIT
jgi:hypothetical protein